MGFEPTYPRGTLRLERSERPDCSTPAQISFQKFTDKSYCFGVTTDLHKYLLALVVISCSIVV